MGPFLVFLGASLAAGGSIGVSDNPLDTAVGTLAATSGGSAYIYESDALTLGTVAPVVVNRVALDSTTTNVQNTQVAGVVAGAHAKVETIAGSLLVTNAVTAGHDVLLAANGVGSDVTLNADVSATAGNATVLAGNSVNQNANITTGLTGTIDVEATTGDIVMGAASGLKRLDPDFEAALVGNAALGQTVVVPGDTTLRMLSLRYYGTSDSWQRIADANGLTDSLVRAGTTIYIPPSRSR